MISSLTPFTEIFHNRQTVKKSNKEPMFIDRDITALDVFVDSVLIPLKITYSTQVPLILSEIMRVFVKELLLASLVVYKEELSQETNDNVLKMKKAPSKILVPMHLFKSLMNSNTGVSEVLLNKYLNLN
jgi:hypothetical protein